MSFHFCLAPLGGLLALLAGPSLCADVFVAPKGSDANPGSKAKPFATLERGREAIRESKRAGMGANQGLTVWLRGGDQVHARALVLSGADPGTPGGVPPEHNVIMRNVCVDKWLEVAWRAESELFDVRDSFVTTSTAQVGAPEQGFRLPKNSPACRGCAAFAPRLVMRAHS